MKHMIIIKNLKLLRQKGFAVFLIYDFSILQKLLKLIFVEFGYLNQSTDPYL